MKTLLLSLVLGLPILAQQPPLRPVTCADAGANDTYTCTASPTLGAYVAGQVVMFTPNTANTGPATLNIDGLGAVTIVKLGGAVNTALANDDLRATQRAILQYDGTNFQMLSQLGNAASGGGGSTIMAGYANGSSAVQGAAATYIGLASNAAPGSTESSVQVPMPRAGTALSLCIKTSTSQPASQALTWTLRKNAVDTAIVATVAGGSAAGTFCGTGSVAYASQDLLSISVLQQAGASNGAAVRMFAVEYQ